MKRFFAFLILASLLLAPGVRAAVDDDYIAIYNTIQQADALSEKNQNSQARNKYLEAQAALKQFQAANPGWNTKVVNYRLNYLANKISQVSAPAPQPAPKTNAPVSAQTNAPAENVSTNASTPAPEPAPATTPTPAPSPAPAPAPATNEPATAVPPTTNAALPAVSHELETQVKSMQEQIRVLENDKSLLESKLKEALSAQPAALDPAELTKAEEKIKGLQKENDLLRVSLAQAKTNIVPSDTAALKKAREALVDANKKMEALAAANKTLAEEKEALQARVKTVVAPDEATSALRAENEILKKELASLKKKAVPSNKADELNRQLLQAQAQVATLQSDKDILRLEKIALENRLKQISVPADIQVAAAASTSDFTLQEKLKELEKQRDELQKSLDLANKELKAKKKGKESVSRIDEMTKELSALRARIDVLEARQIPYSAEELALLSKPDVQLAKANAEAAPKKVHKPLSPEAGKLAAEAQKFYTSREYEKAEEKYIQVLKEDDKNIFTLGNLALIQVERGDLAKAEKTIKQALEVDPDDGYSLWVLGRIKFQEAKYDEALELLSRASQLDPKNAEVQNYLGITLSQKGLRGPAETALRKAIQLDPGYGSAHNNLAVVYVTQTPPLIELARWHYQKALASGQPKNPELEKLLETTKTASK